MANCFRGDEAPDRPLAEDIDDVSLGRWTLRKGLCVFSCSPSSSNCASFRLGLGTAPLVVFRFFLVPFRQLLWRMLESLEVLLGV